MLAAKATEWNSIPLPPHILSDLLQVLHNGAAMALYAVPEPGSPADGTRSVDDEPVGALRWRVRADPGSFAAVDDDQPYPIYGSIDLHWRRAE